MREYTVEKALEKTYASALKTARSNLDTFLTKYKAVMDGTIKPPQYYIDTDQVEFWRNGYINALMREHHVVDQIANQLKEVRGKNANEIMRSLYTQYGHGRLEEIKGITKQCQQYGLTPNFNVMDKQAVRIAVDDTVMSAPMGKIKVIDTYENGKFVRQYIDIQKDDKLRRMLQRELGAAIANGESQRKVIERIRGAFGVEAANAKRIAQTEGTRVRNQARYQTDMEAQEMGIEMDRVWKCRFNHSRDGHMEMDGQKNDENGGWWVPWSSGRSAGVDYMMYPGDPAGAAANVINCHCYVETRVRSNSPALQALRDRNDARRQAWKDENAESNDWRDRLFADGNHPYARNGLPSSEENGIITLRTLGDPMVQVTGAAEASNPEQVKSFVSQLEQNGVSIVRNDYEDLGYSPGGGESGNGTFHVSYGASYSAWCHEMKHFRDAKEMGFPGFFEMISNPQLRDRMQTDAYMIQVHLAREAGREDIAQRLLENLQKERMRIYGDEYKPRSYD